MTVGVLCRRLGNTRDGQPLQDNWIYVQEPDVFVGRIQLFHNWSPWLVADKSKFWLGMEYFASEGDQLWTMPDEEFTALAVRGAGQTGLRAGRRRGRHRAAARAQGIPRLFRQLWPRRGDPDLP